MEWLRTIMTVVLVAAYMLGVTSAENKFVMVMLGLFSVFSVGFTIWSFLG